MSMGIPNPLLWLAIVCNYLAISARRRDQPDIQQHRTTIVFVVLPIVFVNTRSVRPASLHWGPGSSHWRRSRSHSRSRLTILILIISTVQEHDPFYSLSPLTRQTLPWLPISKARHRFILVAINIASFLLWTIWPLLRIKQEALMTPAIAVIWC